MEHYVTLFDSLFLPQGLALHISMERHAGNYNLWILCVDGETFDILTRLNLPNVQLLKLSNLETEELKRVKKLRSKGEYCWTLTPFAPRFVFDSDKIISRVTYIDADMWFRKNPAPIFREFNSSGKHVLITDHSYAPENDYSATSGQYCVQFMTFTRNGGEYVRKWWEKKCVEWCYARFEDGKFGDQKYLDEWPERFIEYVHVLSAKELLLAPWNATRYPFGAACLWHFHSLRIISKGKRMSVTFGNFPLPVQTRISVYEPYIKDLRVAINLLYTHGFQVKPQSTLSVISQIKKMLRGAYNQLWRINLNLKANL